MRSDVFFVIPQHDEKIFLTHTKMKFQEFGHRFRTQSKSIDGDKLDFTSHFRFSLQPLIILEIFELMNFYSTPIIIFELISFKNDSKTSEKFTIIYSNKGSKKY